MSRFARARGKRCVTCPNGVAEHAGHYRHNTERSQSLGGNALWLDLRNINAQCNACNNYRSGSLNEYAIYFEKKHGSGILQELNTLYRTPKVDRTEIEEKRRFFTDAYEQLAFQGMGVVRDLEDGED